MFGNGVDDDGYGDNDDDDDDDDDVDGSRRLIGNGDGDDV
jgi:hypothetical protein